MKLVVEDTATYWGFKTAPVLCRHQIVSMLLLVHCLLLPSSLEVSIRQARLHGARTKGKESRLTPPLSQRSSQHYVGEKPKEKGSFGEAFTVLFSPYVNFFFPLLVFAGYIILFYFI